MDTSKDTIQDRLAGYAAGFDYDVLSPQSISAAKARLINTLGALIAGFFSDPGRIVRALAARVPNDGATVLGTGMKSTPDIAALVNTTTAAYVEMGDTYHWPGSFHGHPSDVVMPVLAIAEYAHASGRDFIAAIVLAYEIYLRFSDVFDNEGFDYTTFGCIAAAAAGSRLLGLDRSRISNAISMAVVPNNILKQARRGQLSMFKSASAGHAGRAGVFAALLARAGMDGPHLPFEGQAGWCDHVALKRFGWDAFGGKAVSFKILDTRIKNRSSSGPTISGILAAEKIAPLRNLRDVKQITVEAYKLVIERSASGERADPRTAESADHSLPYVIAAALIDGTVTRRSFDDAHLNSPELRGLMAKMSIVENADFTRAYESASVQHRIRITVLTNDGASLVGESGGGEDDLSTQLSDEQLEEKFLGISEDYLTASRGREILQLLWRLDDVPDVSSIPPRLVIA